MERIFRNVLLGAVLASMCACANQNSIFRYQKMDPGQPGIVLVDAKQREILVGGKRITTNGKQKLEEIQRFCSAPSPDVFSVVAQALSAGGTFSEDANPASIQAALNAAFSSAEQGSTIPRTQTINMLRELMFRTCERYLNGGIGELELPIQAARDQRLMVSILAIESLTGAVTPKPVVIGASADASGGASGAEAAVRLDNAYKDLQAKTAAQQARQNDYDGINTDKDHCKQIAEAVAKKEEDKLSQELKDKRARCESATSALAAAKKQTGDSASHYATLKDTAASGGIPVAATATLMTPKADGGLDQARGQSIEAVALTVKEIVKWNMDQDEFLFFCLKLMGNTIDATLRNAAIANDVVAECFKYVNSTLSLERAKNDQWAERIQGEMQTSESMDRAETDVQFSKFWALITDDSASGNVSRAKLSTIKAKALAARQPFWPDCFDGATSRTDFKTCFEAIDNAGSRRNLSELGG